MCVVDKNGKNYGVAANRRDGGARPALPCSSILKVSSNGARGQNGILEVEYGEYPQDIVSEDFSITLERAYLNNEMKTTGKSYTTDSVRISESSTSFQARSHTEYQYNGKKYIRFVGDSNCSREVLSDGRKIQNGSPYWVEVKPIKWMIDEIANIALSKKIIFSGVLFKFGGVYNSDFDRTVIKEFMDRHFSKDIIPSKIVNDKLENNSKVKKDNSYDDISKVKNDISYDNISSLINEITEKTVNLEEKYKIIVQKELDEIISSYSASIEGSKKSSSDELFSFSTQTIIMDLSKKLRNIIKKYKLYDDSIELLNKINKYKEYINHGNEDLDKNDKLDKIIIDLKFMLDYYDKEISNSLRNDLEKLFKEIEEFCDEEISTIFNKKIKLSLESVVTLENKLKILYIDYLNKVKENKTYYDILIILKDWFSKCDSLELYSLNDHHINHLTDSTEYLSYNYIIATIIEIHNYIINNLETTGEKQEYNSKLKQSITMIINNLKTVDLNNKKELFSNVRDMLEDIRKIPILIDNYNKNKSINNNLADIKNMLNEARKR